MPDEKILVVGTTSDYIDMLRARAPGKLLFITSHRIRRCAVEPTPMPIEEILCDPTSPEIAAMQLRRHMRAFNVSLGGIACFDCESLESSARIAEIFGLSFPSSEAIRVCRDKALTKDAWRRTGVPCPRSEKTDSLQRVYAFFNETGGPCVLKPLDSSGSERVFKCRTKEECFDAFHQVRAGQTSPDVMVEEFIRGTEYSCDFMVEDGRVQLIRMARKYPSDGQFFGTIMAYESIDRLPDIPQESFVSILEDATASLGISRAVCMLDFIVNENGLFLLELSPRPGGDCLPWLLERSMGLDILKLTLDFAERHPYTYENPGLLLPHVGLRVHADRGGTFKFLDTSRVVADPRVTDVFVKNRPGHRVVMPPADYDGWVLGHILFRPSAGTGQAYQCRELLSLLEIEIDHEPEYSGRRPDSSGAIGPGQKNIAVAG
jgi:biotin carboxylase